MEPYEFNNKLSECSKNDVKDLRSNELQRLISDHEKNSVITQWTANKRE